MSTSYVSDAYRSLHLLHRDVIFLILWRRETEAQKCGVFCPVPQLLSKALGFDPNLTQKPLYTCSLSIPSHKIF